MFIQHLKKNYFMSIKNMLVLLCVIVGLTTTAQNEFKIGAKIGANYSGFNVSGSSTYTNAFGYHLGLIGEYNVSNSFSLQPEIILIQKTGGRGTPPDLAGGVISSDLTYIDIPLNCKYYFTDGLAVEFGPQLEFLVNEKTEVDFYDNNQTDNSIDLATNGFQLSINLGVSYKIIDKYLVQLRYSHGLSDIYKNLEAKNSVFSVSIGYFFL